MKKRGIDISGNTTKSVFDLLDQGKRYDYVITVCDEAEFAKCPVFPGSGEIVNWIFSDPSRFAGTHPEVISKTRDVRNKIEQEIKNWIKSF